MNHDEYVELLKDTALNLGQKFVMQYLISKIPWMALPIVNPLVGFAVGWVLRIALRETEFGAFFLFIDTRTNKQGIEFVDAAKRNAIAQQSGSPKEKSDAEKNLISSFRSFIKFTN